MFLYDNEWKIVSNVNLTKYHTELHNIQNIVNTIVTNCEELKQIEMVNKVSIKGKEGCGHTLYQLNILMADIEENDSNWFGKDKSRTKRHILSDLVSDDWPNNYALLFEEFTNMSALGSETITSPDRETSYIMSSVNSFGTSDDRLAINEYVVNGESVVHNTLVAARNGSVNAVELFQLKTLIQDIISYQTLILTTFAKKQKQYLSILPLVGLKNVQISSVVLSSDTVTSELNNIRNIVIEKGLGLPMKVTYENVYLLLQILSPEIVLYRDQIFVTFKLPLISKIPGNYYSLFKVTSSLTNVGQNVYGYVAPNHEFIAIDAHKERYITLTVDDLNNCRQMKNASMICKQNLPPMQISTSSECEINVLLKRSAQLEHLLSCSKRYIRNNSPILIKVIKPNSWLITMPQAATVRYMCEGRHTQESFVQINGLLTIGNNCKFSTGNVAVTGHNTLLKSSIREHQPNFSEEWLGRSDDAINKILKHSEFVSHNASHVISFGESEKLFRISYTNEDIVAKLKEQKRIWNELRERFLIVFLGELTAFMGIGICIYLIYKTSSQISDSDSSSVIPTLLSKTTDSRNLKTVPKPSAPPPHPSVD